MKTVLITGAAGNLGTAVLRKFLTNGYRVIATVQNREQLDSIESHSNLEARVVNLNDENETSGFITEITGRYGQIAAALLLVGGFTAGDIEHTMADDLRKQYALNFETAYFVARPLFTHMMSHGYGRLVFVGARPALLAAAGKSLVAYALSKSLVFKLAEFLNAEAKGKNVTATVVVPSTIDTPINRQSMPDANPDNWVKASQIADLMAMICSDTGAPLRETVLKVYNNA
jgi:NAD(P)-dependent dehydrogenase (short-subunit alcohol dehydrogenase family)